MLQITVTTDEESGLCPIRNVLARITGKWQSLILLSLEDGALRFSEVKRTVGDITQRVLTQNLRSLERDGFLTRTVKPGPPVEVSYELTSRGVTLVNVMKPLVLWAEDIFASVKNSRADYDARAG
jgi:DNA-binding HxlR family transcriptional regulator